MNQKGFSLAEIVVAMAISSILVLASASLMQLFQEKKSNLNTQQWLVALRQDVTKAFHDRASVQASVGNAQNASVFGCFVNKTNCSGAQGSFRLYNGQNLPVPGVANTASPANGLDWSGLECNTFDAVNGNINCPFRYEVSWRAICPLARAHCDDPQMELKGILKFKPGVTYDKVNSINVSGYQVIHIRDERAQSLDSTCASMNGAPSGGNCVLPIFSQCPAGQYIRGFGSNNTIICGSPASVQCPAGQVILAITDSGEVQCGPGCLSDGSTVLPFRFRGP